MSPFGTSYLTLVSKARALSSFEEFRKVRWQTVHECWDFETDGSISRLRWVFYSGNEFGYAVSVPSTEFIEDDYWVSTSFALCCVSFFKLTKRVRPSSSSSLTTFSPRLLRRILRPSYGSVLTSSSMVALTLGDALREVIWSLDGC